MSVPTLIRNGNQLPAAHLGYYVFPSTHFRPQNVAPAVAPRHNEPDRPVDVVPRRHEPNQAIDVAPRDNGEQSNVISQKEADVEETPQESPKPTFSTTFNDPCANVVFKTSDNVIFRVEDFYLKAAR